MSYINKGIILITIWDQRCIWRFPMVRMKWSDKYFTLKAFLTFFFLHICEGWIWCIVRKSANNSKCAYSVGSFLDLLKRNLHSTFPSINFFAAMSKFSMVSLCSVGLHNYSTCLNGNGIIKEALCLFIQRAITWKKIHYFVTERRRKWLKYFPHVFQCVCIQSL